MIAFSVGGVCYRNLVHTAHLGSVLDLAGASRSSSNPMVPFFSHLDYEHSSNLPRARAEWLRRQIKQDDLQLAVSVDSDSEFGGLQLLTCMVQMIAQPQCAIGIVPMRLGGGGGRLNVCIRPDVRMTAADCNAKFAKHDTFPIWIGGFGVAVFNLDWFRRVWSKPSTERANLESELGEDVEMCIAVQRRGAEVLALKVDSVHRDLVAGDRAELKWAA